MTAANYKKSLDRVLVYEGGFSNHARDPGGATYRGVIQRVYDGYRKGAGQTTRSVRQMTPAEMRAIYRRQYWDTIRGDQLPAGVDFAVFDGAVNSGPVQATKWLQRALRMNRVDGDLGEATVAAALAHPDHDKLVAAICAHRLGMLKRLKTWSTFGKGWSRRVASTLAIGQAWASGSVGPQPVAVAEDGGNAKALIADVALPPADEGAGVNTSASGGGLAAVVQAAKDSLSSVVGTNDTLDVIYAGLTIAGVAVAVGGLAYWAWARRKRRQADAAWSGEAIAEIDPLMPEPA